MASYIWPPSSGSSGIPVYANVAAFPSSGNFVGQQAVDASNVGNIYEWNGSSWVLTASSGAVILGNLTDGGTDGIVVTNGNNCVIGTGTSLAQHVADTSHNGYLSSTDWNTFNNKQPTLTTGNLTSTPTTNLVVTGGTGAVIGTGTLLTLTGASLVEATSAVLTITGATNAVLGTGVSIQVKQSSTSVSGYLSNTDWNIFNGKQAAGNYITALTGEGSASGPGSVALTLTNSAVIGKVLTGYVSGAGTVASTDTILQAIQKLNGNIGGLTGTVTSVSVVTANGVSGTVATATTTPAITIVLGAITPSSMNVSGLTASSAVATDSSKNLVSIANTGTGNNVLASSPTLTTPALGTPSAIVLTNATGLLPAAFGTETARTFLQGPASGSAAAPTFAALTPPLSTTITATGTQTGWVFAVTSANATLGAVYTNNSNSFTVQGTIAAGTLLFMTGTGATTGSTLTKSTGTGDATITFSAKFATATYTPATNPPPLAIRVEGIGGGGGGASNSNGSTAATGATAQTTYVGPNLIVLPGGTGGNITMGNNSAVTAPTLGSGVSGVSVQGQYGQIGLAELLVTYIAGGKGASSRYGDGATGGPGNSAAPNNAIAYGTGGGGGGAGNQGQGANGGSSGSYCDVLFTGSAILTSYAYVIGTGGAGNAAGTFAGSNGANGCLTFTEYYQ